MYPLALLLVQFMVGQLGVIRRIESAPA